MAEPGVTTYCYCWVITRTDGTVIGTTDHDEDVTVDGYLCRSAPGITTTRFSQSLGLDPDDLEVEGYIDGDDIRDEDIRGGLFDNAAVRLYIVDWADPTEFRLLSTGTLGQVVETEGGGFMAQHLSLADDLMRPVGRTYQRTCDTKLGSARCGVNLDASAYRVTATVTVIDAARLTVTGLGPFDDDWFSLGTVTTAAGYEVAIRNHVGDTLDLWREPEVAISVGDEIVVTAGCRQDIGTCAAKFNNVPNFQGFPRMPGRDQMVTYPVRGIQKYDGRSLFS